MTPAPKLPAAKTLFPIRANDTDQPLVFMPDLGGNVLYARKLVRVLSPKIDCYAMRLPRQTVASENTVSVEDLAASFARDLAAHPFNGPLNLAGLSFAGLLAFETARALFKMNVPLGRIWLFDSRAHRLNLTRAFFNAPRHEARAILRYFKDNWRRALGFEQDKNVLRSFRLIPLDLKEIPAAYHPTVRKLYTSLENYRPAPWAAAPVTLFRASDDMVKSGRPQDLGWQRLTGKGTNIVDLPGNHLSILERDDALALAALEIATTLETQQEDETDEQR